MFNEYLYINISYYKYIILNIHINNKSILYIFKYISFILLHAQYVQKCIYKQCLISIILIILIINNYNYN